MLMYIKKINMGYGGGGGGGFFTEIGPRLNHFPLEHGAEQLLSSKVQCSR